MNERIDIRERVSVSALAATQLFMAILSQNNDLATTLHC